ncbi:MAG: hypothetical protein KA369_08385 [Spirochaetes bacterium]|nr:hypothetical protein [Spirochaetota bacterium]
MITLTSVLSFLKSLFTVDFWKANWGKVVAFAVFTVVVFIFGNISGCDIRGKMDAKIVQEAVGVKKTNDTGGKPK